MPVGRDGGGHGWRKKNYLFFLFFPPRQPHAINPTATLGRVQNVGP